MTRWGKGEGTTSAPRHTSVCFFLFFLPPIIPLAFHFCGILCLFSSSMGVLPFLFFGFFLFLRFISVPYNALQLLNGLLKVEKAVSPACFYFISCLCIWGKEKSLTVQSCWHLFTFCVTFEICRYCLRRKEGRKLGKGTQVMS